MGELHLIDYRINDKCTRSAFAKQDEHLRARLGRAVWILALHGEIWVPMARETRKALDILPSCFTWCCGDTSGTANMQISPNALFKACLLGCW